jgi:steroid 5-alpha reductase family enzyme
MGAQRLRARAWCTLAYAAALAAAAAVVMWAPIESPWWRVVAADLAATVVVFGFSRAFDNSSFYDPYWSVAPIVMALYWSAIVSVGDSLRAACIVGVVAAWGVRLTYNWIRHWRGLDHEDWRYVDLRARSGRAYWLVAFAGLHLFPTVQVLLGCTALYAALVGPSRFGWLDMLGCLAGVTAVVIEATADRQLHRFAEENRDPERILDTGLWAWSRHPNYFGEVLFWWSLFLFAIAADRDEWWTVVGATMITAMFVFVSIPLLEKRMLAKRPHYAEHQKRVPALVPWRPRA